MASIIKRLWSGSDFWDKEENKQQRQQYAAPRPQPEMEQKIKTARYGVLANNPQRQQQFIQDTKATPGPSILSTVHNAINDTLNANTQADQQRRLSQGLPRYYQDQSNLSKITRAAETGGRVTARVLQGIGQDTLGTYDLLTPGHGINRATKYYQNRGAQTDQEVKDMGLDENVYKAGQVPLALGSYMIPGKAVSNVGKIPRVARAGAAVERVVSKVPGATKAIGALDDLAANGDRFQRVTSRLVRSYTRPGNIADVGVDALQNAGHRTSLGQDNSLSTAGLDIGMSLGMQGGLNLAGQAVAPAIQTTTRLAKNTANNLMDSVAPVQTTTRLVKRTNRLNLDTTDALKAYSDMLVDADPYIQGKIRSDLIARVRDIGDQLGVDLTNGSVADKMERIEAILNGYLPITETGRKLALTPLNEGGYIAGPLALDFRKAQAEGKVFKGVDGKPRFEVDDSGAKIKNPEGNTLGEVLDHPLLFNQYDDLRNMPVTKGAGIGDARFDPKTNSIEINPQLAPEKLRRTLLHELQHGIQEKEGFAGGASPRDYLRKYTLENESIKRGLKEVNDQLNAGKVTTEQTTKLRRRRDNLIKQLEDTQDQYGNVKNGAAEAMDKYWRTAGEAEARAVEARMNMPMSERYVSGINPAPEKSLPDMKNEFDGLLQKIRSRTATDADSQRYSILKDRIAVAEGKKGAPNPERWVADKPIKLPDVVYRGTSKDSGSGFAMFGGGKYTAASKAEAAKYGTVQTLGKESLPSNPLQFKTTQDFSQWEYEMARKLGVNKNELYDTNKGAETLINAIGHDGVTIGTGKDLIAVKFSPETISEYKPRSTFYDSLDVPKEDLIIRNDGGKAMSIDKLEEAKQKIRDLHQKSRETGDVTAELQAKQEYKDLAKEVANQDKVAETTVANISESEMPSPIKEEFIKDYKDFKYGGEESLYSGLDRLAGIKESDYKVKWDEPTLNKAKNMLGWYRDFPQLAGSIDATMHNKLTSVLENVRLNDADIKLLNNTQPTSGVAMSIDSSKDTNPLESLKQEARKYKSAEEFVKAKTNQYHGTLDKEFKLDPNSRLFLTGDTDSASTYAGRRYNQEPEGKVVGYHAKDGKTLDLNDNATREEYVRDVLGQNKQLKKYYDQIPESARNDYFDTLGWVMEEHKAGRIPKADLDKYTEAQKNYKGISSKDVYANWDKIIARAKKDGYDYIKHTTEDPSAEITFPETVALNPSKTILDKQQLTDLYNQALKESQPVGKKTWKQINDEQMTERALQQEYERAKNATTLTETELQSVKSLSDEYITKLNNSKSLDEAIRLNQEYMDATNKFEDGTRQYSDAFNDMAGAVDDAYMAARKAHRRAAQPPKSTLVQKQAPQPTKVATPFEKDLQAVGLAPSPQAKGSVGIPSRSTPKKPQRLEVPSDQTTELPRLRQSKANPANQPSNRNEVLSKETPVNAVDSTTNTKNTKPGLESRTPKKSLKTPQEKPVVSGTSRKLSTPEVKQPQNLQQPSTTASAGVGGQAVSKTQPEAYKQPKESQVSQNQVQSQESSSKTRGFIKSVLEDPNTNPKVKESISSLYTVRNTKELQTKAATLVKEHPDIAEQMSKSANDDASVAVAMELVKKHQNAGDYTRAIDLVESVAKDLTEAGRTVQAASIYGRLTPEGILRFTQKEINNYNKATGKDIKLTPKAADTLKTMADDLQKMPDGYDKDVAVAKMIAEVQKTMPATTAEKISTFQTMAQLLNPKTIIRNELGNSAFLGLENISQTVATPVDALMSLFTGKRTTTLPSVKTQVKGLIEGRKKGVSEAFQGINTGASTQYDLNSVPVFRGKVLGNLEKTMGAALRGGDRANYTAAFDDSLKGSMKLAKTKTATPEMLEAAHHAGLYRTFQDQNVISNFFVGMKKTLNTVGIGIKGKRFGLGDMVLKYPKTPANLLARGIDYSPAGFVKTVFEMSKPLFGKQFDQKVFVDSLSRATTGTAGLVGTGAMLGSLGIITEAPEKDKDLRDLQKQSGLGGYQINVSGLKRFVASGFSKDAAKLREGDKLVSYDWAQPAAIPVSMGAAIGKGKGAKEGAGKSVSALTEGIQTITEQPMVRGLQQFFGSNKGAGGIVGDLLKDTPASFIPTLSNQVRQLTDNTNRNTYDPSVLTESMNRVKNKIPGLASSVPARIGSLGETRENYQNGSNNPFNVFFNPSFVSNYDPKETAKLPLGINQRTGEVKQAPRSISTTQTVNGKSVKITAQQNQDLQKYVGTETDKAFSQLMKNPAFMALSDEEKANKMGTLITNINKAGKVLILGDEGYGTDSYKPTKLDRGVRDVLGGKYDYSTRSMKTGAASPDYAQQYADLKADFNDPSNGWSDVQKVAKTKELKRLEIKKDYDADTVALHSMSKADMYAYVSKAKNGKQLAEKLIAYDNALYEAGLSQYRKYKNGIAPASKGGGRKSGGRGGKRKAIPKDLMAKAMDVPKVAQLRQSKITAKQPQARSFKTRRKAIPKIAKSTPKLTVKRTQTA